MLTLDPACGVWAGGGAELIMKICISRTVYEYLLKFMPKAELDELVYIYPDLEG